MPFQQGENVGPYRIIEQLGQGGMATVFKAYHPNLDRYVAIKVLHPAFNQDPQFTERFQREARVVAKLDHPNIVPVFDYADHGGQSYLVMKFIEGETLKGVIDRQWPTKAQILGIVRSVGSALSYAHRKGVLHRDVKPSNILLAGPGSVYLADFGLARIAEAGESTLSGDQLLGTPQYISPEQARGEKDLDAGTDIYSLGIVLYQLAVGRVPYSSDTPFSIIHDHIYTPLPMPRAINQKIPEDLERVLLKALAKDRSDRFATVQDLVSAFDSAARGISPWDAQGVDGSVANTTAAAAAEAVAQLAGISATEGVGEAPAEQIGGTAAKSLEEVPAGQTGPAAEQELELAPLKDPIMGAKSTRKSSRWAWVGGGLAFAVLSVLMFGFAMSSSEAGPIGESTDVAAAVDQVQRDSFEDSPHGSAQAAWQRVNEEPDSAEAHLELAQALASDGDLAPAKSEYIRASELYLEQANYVRAAESLVKGLEKTGASAEGDLRVSNILSQALFLGAESGGMFPSIDALYEISPGWTPLETLDARSLLFEGQTGEAQSMVENVLNSSPEDILASAVMIDVLHQSGDDEQALQLINKLLQRPRTPPWLDKHLRDLQAVLSS